MNRVAYREFPFGNESTLAELCERLISEHRQFSVCPYPQDLKSRAEGLAISWPLGSGEQSGPLEAVA